MFASVAFIALAWYVADYTGFGRRVVLWLATAAFVVVGGLVLAAPEIYYGSDAGTETMTLPWGEVIRLAGSEPGLGLAFAAVAQLVLIGYIIAAGVQQYRAGERQEARVLAVGVGWFGLALVIETVASLGVVDVPPAADFGFLGFLFALSFAMVNEAIEGERELVQYQASLEDMVASRTADLEGAQQQLVVQAEEAATAAERVRISRDLHDAVSQLLFSIRLLAGSLPKLWRSDPQAAERSTLELQRLAGGALAEMRTLLRELRPEIIPHTNLELLIA
ncbi:MAG: histidine kinase dimerization/phosphoacceptor domain-containing protein, partial [Acidimicrobiia bacterium]